MEGYPSLCPQEEAIILPSSHASCVFSFHLHTLLRPAYQTKKLRLGDSKSIARESSQAKVQRQV